VTFSFPQTRAARAALAEAEYAAGNARSAAKTAADRLAGLRQQLAAVTQEWQDASRMKQTCEQQSASLSSEAVNLRVRVYPASRSDGQ